ncbi:H-NS histone family protein [Duganella dendranthematis]|uniref:H-NS histone family protein n=1 Tax=Duganella dendranthematis TaxID=2728021 RepID=A0ABX6MAJ5_9BURK|nr:H-NS family nucleoid-associated regulatory protein [Duganella dendranthematis]QJD91250.1 H-NS histone family protein [Duganella dendranthematis]
MFALNIPTSSNVADLLAKKAELEALAKKNQEDLYVDRPLFIAQVRELIKTFGITKVEAFPPSKDKQAIVDKDYSLDYFFRDPTTGEEWDGKGKRPSFLSKKKKTDDFRIYHATNTKFPPVAKSVPSPVESATSAVEPSVIAAPDVADTADFAEDVASPAVVDELVVNAAQQITAAAMPSAMAS